eukprot:6431924-Karenia_brevis.AAC.1
MKRKRGGWEAEDEHWISMVPCMQWNYASSIGGGLYNTGELDGLWNRDYTFELIADNETLVNILSGVAEPTSTDKDTISDVLRSVSEIMLVQNWGPRKIAGCPIQWRRRNFNKEADYLANHAMDTRAGFNFTNRDL